MKCMSKLAIYCYHTESEWWDGHLTQGSAGSEEAVVEVARRLATRDWQVEVYNNCGAQKRIVNGVTYIPITDLLSYRADSPKEVTILWRKPQMCDYSVNTVKKYLWLQDVVHDEELSTTRLASLDKIIAISKYQRSLWPNVPDAKVFHSSNGISVTELEKFRSQYTCIKRNQKKCIYTSAPDRGLECLLKLWPAILGRVSDAELHVFYGWKFWDGLYSRDLNKLAWKRQMLSLLCQPGVMTPYTYKTSADLWIEYLTSGVWLYPTEWPETSCISAMKAQACGAFPATTSFAALSETVIYGTRVHVTDIYENEQAQQDLIDAVVQHIERPDEADREDMMYQSLQRFSWDRVVEKLDDELRRKA